MFKGSAKAAIVALIVLSVLSSAGLFYMLVLQGVFALPQLPDMGSYRVVIAGEDYTIYVLLLLLIVPFLVIALRAEKAGSD